jgi:hypothetical protein
MPFITEHRRQCWNILYCPPEEETPIHCYQNNTCHCSAMTMIRLIPQPPTYDKNSQSMGTHKSSETL